MDFSEFVQLLYPYKSKGSPQSEFVIYLTNFIMSPRMSKDGERQEREWGFNPFDNIKADTLSRIYSGKRQMSKSMASKILNYLDKECFEKFIAETPPETIKLIRIDLQKKGISCSDEEVHLICADIFVSILNDCANKERKQSQKTSMDQASQFVQTTDLTSDFQMDSTSTPAETSASVITIDSSVKKVQSVWDPEPAYMPKDFYEYTEKYAIGDIINLDPMELIEINYMTSENRPDGEEIIWNSVRYVKAMEDAMQRAEISFLNEKICKAISAFVKSLREYIDFLMENAESPDFSILPFLLAPVDTDVFKRKAVYHNSKLRSILRQIVEIQEHMDRRRAYSLFT